MTKQELIAEMAALGNLSKKDAEIALNAFLKIVGDTIATGEKIKIVDFGTFETRDRAEKLARNPQKPDELVSLPAHKAACFKPGKALKDKVNAK